MVRRRGRSLLQLDVKARQIRVPPPTPYVDFYERSRRKGECEPASCHGRRQFNQRGSLDRYMLPEAFRVRGPGRQFCLAGGDRCRLNGYMSPVRPLE